MTPRCRTPKAGTAEEAVDLLRPEDSVGFGPANFDTFLRAWADDDYDSAIVLPSPAPVLGRRRTTTHAMLAAAATNPNAI